MHRACFMLSVVVWMVVTTTGLAAEGFRCETDVFVGTEKNPVQQTLTVFHGDVVYDFLLGQSKEITVYDVKHGAIKLLDPQRELCCTIVTDDLLQVAAMYKTRKPESELFKFCTEPKFAETFADNVLKLDSPQVKYQVACIQPKQRGAEQRYRDFADWSARLNSIRPGNLPPFPRIELNKALAAQGMLPEEIERTISTTHLTGRRTETVRSRHLFNWILSGRDQALIEEVGDHLVKFKPATAEDYLGLAKKTARK
jgi:hypothetical protein